MKPFSAMSIAFLSICLHLLLLFTLIFQPCKATSSLGNKTDHLSLLKFKGSISNDPYQILDSWNTSTHFCSWHGITCSHRHQRVTKLELNGFQLHGSISPHIGNLSFLRIINLDKNSFYREIPQELGCFFQLQGLYLCNNSLSNLRYLKFGQNNLIGNIPMEIGSFHNLEGLYLYRNHLTGPILASICNLSSLSILSMNSNNLEGNVPEEIGRLKNLIIFQVALNNLSGAIPSSLYNLSSLTEIVVLENQINYPLPNNMFTTLHNLQLLDLGANQFSGPIPTSIVYASMLVEISISLNHLEGQVPNLGKLHDLSFLGLGFNNLGSNSTKD